MKCFVKALRAAVLFACCLTTSIISAQTNTWIGSETGNWDDPTNWSLGVVPPGPEGAGQNVHIDANTQQDSTIQIGSGSIFGTGSLRIDENDALQIGNNASLSAGPIQNSGTIQIMGGDPTNTNRGLQTNSLLRNLPTGQIALQEAYLGVLTPSSLGQLWNQGTISGSGRIAIPTIWNDHLIEANAGQLIIEPDAFNFSQHANVTNTGTLRARNGGGLTLLGSGSFGVLQNQPLGLPGTIEAQGDSKVVIQNNAITGGRVITSTTGGVEEGEILLQGSASLVGVELDAQARIFGTLYDSTFTNRRTLSVDESLLLFAENTIAGGGIVELGRNSSNTSVVAGNFNSFNQPLPKLTNLDNTIRVASIDDNFTSAEIGRDLLVENHGVIEAQGNLAALQINTEGPNDLPSGNAAWKNRGTIRAIGGGSINLRGRLDHSLDNTGGVIEIDAQSSFNGGFDSKIIGGTLRGSEALGSAPMFNFAGEVVLEDLRLEGIVRWDNHLRLTGAIENTGSLSSQDEISLQGTEVTLTGGGQVSTRRFHRDTSQNSSSRLTNVDNTLQIEGDMTFGQVELANRGVIEASNPSTGNRLQLFSNSPNPSLTNSGTIRAIAGAFLELDDRLLVRNYEFDSQGNYIPGMIQAGADSEVSLQGVIGGVVQAAAGGRIRFQRWAPLNIPEEPVELHLLGHIEAESPSIFGTIRNDGQFQVTGTVHEIRSNEILPGTIRLLGNGAMVLDNGLLRLPTGAALINGPQHTITGDGRVEIDRQLFVNEGRFEAREGETVTLAFSGAEFLFQQQGELISSGSGLLTLTGHTQPAFHLANDGLIESRDQSTVEILVGNQFTNRGTMRVNEEAFLSFVGDLPRNDNALINAEGAELHIAGRLVANNAHVVNKQGGLLQGGGNLDFQGDLQSEMLAFTNHGTLAVGELVGQFDVLGNFQQSSTGTFKIDLGGTNFDDDYDTLSTFSAELGGLLDISLVDLGNGIFEPQLGDSFRILQTIGNGNIVTGRFDSYQLPQLEAGLVWNIAYLAEAVELNIVNQPQTDLDQDSDIDGKDFLSLQRTDPVLISQWQTEYGTKVIITTTVPLAAVPEPASLLLLLTTGCLFVFVRIPRQKATNENPRQSP